jgi:nitroimidazol reductase NimA-like FMN-containing flavoprotein (pyridoxamine 5'-phosphate oxidase superfamily)
LIGSLVWGQSSAKWPHGHDHDRPTERTRVRRLPQRAAYDHETILAILHSGFVCHLGLVDRGRPVVIPTAYARVGDHVIVHGSTKAGFVQALAAGAEACVTVTHIDGFVMARSAFHHSVNYRSVVIFGRGEAITGEAEKNAALEAFFERIHPGRWDVVRPPTTNELRQTGVVRIPIDEASAKVRTGGPIDDAEDLALDVWAGVIPLALTSSTPIPDVPNG